MLNINFKLRQFVRNETVRSHLTLAKASTTPKSDHSGFVTKFNENLAENTNKLKRLSWKRSQLTKASLVMRWFS